MRLSRTSRAAGLLVCVFLAGLLSACSSSHDTKASATTAASHGSEAGSGSVVAAVPGVGTAQQRSAAAANNPVTVKTSKVLARLSTGQVAAYKVVRGSATAGQRFGATTKALPKGVSVTYYRATQAGVPAADIAVYRFQAEQATSKIFQGQIVSQLVSSVAKSHKVKFDKVSGSLFTVAGKSPAAIGTFQGQSAIVVLGETGSDSLLSATGAAYAYLGS